MARFAHVSYERVERAVDACRGEQFSTEVVATSPCVGCSVANSVRKPFAKGSSVRPKAPLDLVHADLCTLPLQAESGNSSFALYTEGYLSGYGLPLKSSQPEAFRHFRVYAERIHKKTVSTFRTDNGGEEFVFVATSQRR